MADRPVLMQRAYKFGLEAANGRNSFAWLVPPALLFGDGLLCLFILWKIPYTEIDWVAYMQQVSQYVSGERDYSLIEGDTGPLVYPAAHVYIYTGLYYVTDRGRDIFLAQQIFALLYLATLGLVMACYWKAQAPPYLFPLLTLSKRLHSIFMLRCFNDCFAVFFLWLSIYWLQRRKWEAASIAFSLGVGVKMTLLLSLPAVGLVLFLGWGFTQSLRALGMMVAMQGILSVPFITVNAWAYSGGAFDFSRQFMFKWTVNWRFVGEHFFLSKPFALLLLGLHLTVLAAFIVGRYLRPAGRPMMDMIAPILLGARPPFLPALEAAISRDITPRYVLSTVLSATVVGLLFARSLHYQFYTYLAWSTPFLLWRSGIHPFFQYTLWLVQEWAWNVYPSTPVSSGLVVGVLALTVMLVWQDGREEWRTRIHVEKPETAKR